MMCRVHAAMEHEPWLQGFEDLVDRSRIMLCHATCKLMLLLVDNCRILIDYYQSPI
jgi:hypothetical protein